MRKSLFLLLTLYCACVGRANYGLVVIFPDQESFIRTGEVSLSALAAKEGITCKDLVDGTVKASELNELARVTVGFPSNDKPELSGVEPGRVWFFVEARGEDVVLLRGCTEKQVVAGKGFEVEVHLQCVCNAPSGHCGPENETMGDGIDNDCDGQTDEGCGDGIVSREKGEQCDPGEPQTDYCCNQETCQWVMDGEADPQAICQAPVCREAVCDGLGGCRIQELAEGTSCGLCQVCSGGNCVDVEAGQDPHDDCEASGCVNTGVCDGQGECAVPVYGTDPNGFCPEGACALDYCSGSGGCAPADDGTACDDGISGNEPDQCRNGHCWGCVPEWKATLVGAGGLHACAITTEGGVRCWGRNDYGQLGDGTMTDRLSPVTVTGLSSGVTAVAVGNQHTCALLNTGGVKCWGYNYYGQLGDGTTRYSTLPVAVTGLSSGVVKITAGKHHSCALLSSGGIKCWGANGFYQLGDGTDANRSTPVDVVGLSSGVVAIVAGNTHTCALLETGGVKCWGEGSGGRLGNGSNMNQSTPVDVNGLSSGVKAIAAGGEHSCALLTSGGVKCWGSGSSGQLGNGSTMYWMSPTDVSGLSSGVEAIGAGGAHTCALLTSGGLKCWGDNTYGQVGDGSMRNRLTPVDVVGLPGTVVALEAGSSHTCVVLSTGGVKCWGWNGYGQIGNGTTSLRLIPTEVRGLSSAAADVDLGDNHTCVLLLSGGASCWGYNDKGQLGDGTWEDRHVPTDVSGLSTGVRATSSGRDHTCALLDTGGVKCWGYNFYGQLGDDTNLDRAAPVAVHGLSTGVSAITAGSYHTCALLDSGTVLCWGRNTYGQLGDGTTNERHTPVPVNGLSSRVTAIAAGWGHNCALLEGGGVWCWGANGSGQLGNGSNNQSTVPVEVSGLSTGAVAISTLNSHSCALLGSGIVECWGDNISGQLGDGTAYNRTTPVVVIGLTSGTTAISAGEAHTCALLSTGGVMCWGKNSSGQLGDGTTNESRTPVEAYGLSSGVTRIAAGANHTCVVISSGGVRCWGKNVYGQLGDGTSDGIPTPLSVSGTCD